MFKSVGRSSNNGRPKSGTILPKFSTRGRSSDNDIRLLSYKYNPQETVGDYTYQLNLSSQSEDIENKIDFFIQQTSLSKLKPQVGRQIANKFITVKDDINKAIEFFKQYEITRLREKIFYIWTHEPLLFEELQSKQFTIIPVLKDNPLIIIFHCQHHEPSKSPILMTLRAFMCHLDALIESNVESVKLGLVFIFDMKNVSKEKFDHMLGHKLFKFAKETCTVPLRAMYVVSSPSWFHSIYKVTSVNEIQMRKIIESILNREFIPKSIFPSSSEENNDNQSLTTDKKSALNFKIDRLFKKWPAQCFKILQDGKNAFLNLYYTNKRPTGYHLSTMQYSIENSKEDETRLTKSIAPLHVSQTFYLRNVQLVNVQNFVQRISQRKIWEQLSLEFRSVESVCKSTYDKKEIQSFKYFDIVCLESTRVVLNGSLDGNNYIHANYVDGASQSRAYISTQGPLKNTFGDFWQMIWEQHVYIIVMVTKLKEKGIVKCDEYWPSSPNEIMHLNENIWIENKTSKNFMDWLQKSCSITSFDDCKISVIELNNEMPSNESLEISDLQQSINHSTNTNTRKSSRKNTSPSKRLVYHFQFDAWPDTNVPSNPDSLLRLRYVIRQLQSNLTRNDESWTGHPSGPPIVIHCSAGIGRTGSFCVIDICLTSLEQSILSRSLRHKENRNEFETKNQTQSMHANDNADDNDLMATMLSVPEVLLSVRNQRAHSVQNSKQYTFCYEAIFRYITTCLSRSTSRIIMNMVNSASSKYNDNSNSHQISSSTM